MGAYAQCAAQAHTRRKRSVRYALLSLLLTLVLLTAAGCSLLLFGDNRTAYDRMCEAADNFKYPSSLQITSGVVTNDGHLYCIFRAKNGFGNYRSDSYHVYPGGYMVESSSRMCYYDDINCDLINQAYGTGTGFSYHWIGGTNMDSGLVMFLWIVILIVALCLHGLLASKASDVACDKGYEKRTWFHMCFWLGFISFVIIAAMPDKKLREQTNTMILLQRDTIELLQKGGVAAAPAQDSFTLPEL